jgi:hypothetical protein
MKLRVRAFCVVLCAFIGACAGRTPQCNFILEDQPVTLKLSCVPASAPTVELSGACAATSGGTVREDPGGPSIWVTSAAGTCHIALTFSTGYTSATDMSFDVKPQPCGGGNYTVPRQQQLNVANAPDTCADAGP